MNIGHRVARPPDVRPVICRGSPREIGLAQGRALRDRIRAAPSLLRDLEAFRLLEPWWMPFRLFRLVAAHRARALWQDRLADAAPNMAQRLEGLAHGAGVRLAHLQLLNILEPMMADLRSQIAAPPLGGCSAIAVTGARAAGGEPVIARNFDYLRVVSPFYAMRDTRPAGGLRSIDFTIAPLAGAVDGINEAGLCITNNYAFVRDEPTWARTISMVVSEALETCTTVRQAIDLLRSESRWGGGILMLADAEGDIASVELSNRSFSVRRPSDGENLLFHTNRFRTESMRDAELDGDAHYSDRAPMALRGTSVHEPSAVRDRRFAELVEHQAVLTAADLARIMADHGPEDSPSDRSICMHGDYWYTTATLQFFPVSRRLRVAFDSTCRARFTELSFDREPVSVGVASDSSDTNRPLRADHEE